MGRRFSSTISAQVSLSAVLIALQLLAISWSKRMELKKHNLHTGLKYKHPIPSEFLRAIGDVVVSFALLESELKSTAEMFIGGPGRSASVVTELLPMKGIRLLLEGTFRERYGSLESRLEALLKRTGELEELRNQIMHSLWAAGPSGSITRIKTTCRQRKGLKYKFDEMSLSQFESLSLRMRVCANDFQCWKLDFIEEVRVGTFKLETVRFFPGGYGFG